MLNPALVNPQPLAQIVRTFLALEALGQDEVWTVAQGNLIEKLATDAPRRRPSGDRALLETMKPLDVDFPEIGGAVPTAEKVL